MRREMWKPTVATASRDILCIVVRRTLVGILLSASLTLCLCGVSSSHERANPTYASRSALVHDLGHNYGVTPALSFRGSWWIVAASQPTDTAVDGPILTVKLYSLSRAGWRQVSRTQFVGGQVGFFSPSDAETGALSLASVTGGSLPDVVVLTQGADTNWFALIAHVGGHWRAVSFDFGETPTIGIDANGIEGRVVVAGGSTCGCAANFPMYAWMRFDRTWFVPTVPPWTPASCSPAAFNQVLRTDKVAGARMTRVDCKDGWAVARGTGKHGGASGIFEQIRSRWLVAGFNDTGKPEVTGGPTYQDLYVFPVPMNLVAELCAKVGEPYSWVVDSALTRLEGLDLDQYGVLYP